MIPLFPKLDKNKKTIENIPVKELLNQYSSPLFVMSERIITEKYRLFSEALAKYYPNSQIAYSIKTNYLPGLVNIVKNLGAWAETVSGFEYWLAKKLGFSGNQIIFNGPDKKTADIESALKEESWLNIDNQNELERAGRFAENCSESIKLGLRVNTDMNPSGGWNRFGFNLENGEAYSIVKIIKKEFPNLHLIGLHIHMGTNINEPRFYSKATERLADFAIKIKTDFDFDIEYLDLGGGLAVPGSRWMNNPVWVVPEIDDYIKGVSEILNQKFTAKKPKLIFEPGRYLVDEAGIFLTTVTNVKKTPTNFESLKENIFAKIAGNLQIITPESQLINVDSSAVSVFQSTLHRRNIIEVIKQDRAVINEQEVVSYIGGNSCIGSDFLAWNISLPKISVGDTLIFYNAGAYAIPRNEQFIHPRPAVVMIKENGDIECIRKKESYENMISLDSFG